MNLLKFNTYKQYILAAVLLLSAGAAAAQQDQEQDQELPQLSKNQWAVYLKGPFSKLKIDMGPNGDSKNGFGVGVGLQYNRYLTQQWSLSGGLEFQPYHSDIHLNNFSDAYGLTDAEGDDMEFRAAADRYHEEQTAGMLNIPIRVQWETAPAPRQLFAATGVQLGIPLYANYSGTYNELETSGYFPQWDAELTSPEFMGFGQWGTQRTGQEKLKLKTSYSLLFELGVKQQLQENRAIYLSAYYELGLNDLTKSANGQQALINYNIDDPTAFEYASVIDSAPGATGSNYARKLKTRSFGLKLICAFGW